MTEHQTKIPKRRFKGFTGEWESMRLDNFCVVNPKTCEIPDQFYYIDLESVEKGVLIESKIIDKKKAPSRAQRLLSIGDILFQTVRPYQQNNYLFKIDNRIPTVASTGYAQIRTNEDNRFLYYLLHTNKFNKDVMIRCTGSNYPAINSTDLLEIDITVPNIQEQQKIGEFFSELDERIELQKSKIEKMKALKKAYLSEMFPAEGETTPKRRFKGFTGEWEGVKLGELCNITTGKLDANAMVENGEYRFYTCAREYFKIDKYAFDTEALLISGNGANVGYIHYYNGKFNAYQRTYVLTDFKENIFFIMHYLNNHLQKRILQEKNEGNTPYIVLSTLSEMQIKFPSFKEQQKIGEFFSELDEMIELHEEKLKKLQDLKQAYLNELLI